MFKQCTDRNGFVPSTNVLSCSTTPVHASAVFPLPTRDIKIPRYVKTPRPRESEVYDFLLKRRKRSLFEKFAAFVAGVVEKVKTAVICK